MGPTVASLVHTKSVQPQSHLLPRYSAAARRAGGRQNSRKSRDFLLFWRPPGRRAAAEYLGSKWDWGWTLFVWTSEATVGPMRADLATRGYLAQWLTREGFLSFLHRATEIGGVLFDGELEDGGARIRAEPQQLVRRLDAATVLDG